MFLRVKSIALWTVLRMAANRCLGLHWCRLSDPRRLRAMVWPTIRAHSLVRSNRYTQASPQDLTICR